jgi:hypothetical protein
VTKQRFQLASSPNLLVFLSFLNHRHEMSIRRGVEPKSITQRRQREDRLVDARRVQKEVRFSCVDGYLQSVMANRMFDCVIIMFYAMWSIGLQTSSSQWFARTRFVLCACPPLTHQPRIALDMTLVGTLLQLLTFAMFTVAHT